MSSVEQQIFIGVAVLIIGALIIGVAKLGISSFSCLKQGQAEIKETCQSIALTLKGYDGRFCQGEQWMEMHQQSDDKAFLSVQEQHRDIKDLIARCTHRHEEG